MMVRVPVLNKEQIEALRMILRLDYSRSLKAFLTKGDSIDDTRLNIFRLTDLLGQAEQPLIVGEAMMDFQNRTTCMLPLNQKRFDFFSKQLLKPIEVSDFSMTEKEKLEDLIFPLNEKIEELKKIFEDAAFVDSDAMKENNKILVPATGLN
jgi:hypothetical protein